MRLNMTYPVQVQEWTVREMAQIWVIVSLRGFVTVFRLMADVFLF